MCRDACYELAATPPTYLRCSARVATKIPKDDRPCCLVWGCKCRDHDIILVKSLIYVLNAGVALTWSIFFFTF